MVLTPCDLVIDSEVSEKDVASIFSIKDCI
jgi:hypothetical protein